MPSRRLFNLGLSTAATALLSSCGTVIYPDRVHQKERGHLDPAIILLDGIGLFFFLIPGVIAFAVDFATGAIYYPAEHEAGDAERTVFDGLSRHTPRTNGRLRQSDIEQAVAQRTGNRIDVSRPDLRAAELDHLCRFWPMYARLSRGDQRSGGTV